jgi:hypothetical protein
MGFDPVTMAIGTIVLGAGSSIAGGFAENSAKQAEASQYDRNAKLAKLGADQEEVVRREDLLATISSINAIRTSRGLDVASPTGEAITQHDTMLAERGIGTERLNALNQAQAYGTQAAISRSQGTSAILGGFMKAGTSILSTGLLDKKKA